MTDEEAREALDQNAKDMLKDPAAWWTMGQTLQLAGDLLHREYEKASRAVLKAALEGNGATVHLENRLNVLLHRPAQMMWQQAIENYLKAIIVKNGGDWEKTHELSKLAGKGKVGLTPEEKEMLDFLDRMNQLGRYRVGWSEKRGYATGTVELNSLKEGVAAFVAKLSGAFPERIV